MKKILFLFCALMCGLVEMPVRGQDQPVPPPAPAYQPLSADQLDQLLGPIALYPDPLIAQILPACTLPYQIVLADRYISAGGDPNAVDQQPWDASVQAMSHYPTVLSWLDANLQWASAVGQAFLNQQQDVMDAIQRLRTTAYNLGNLPSTPQQQVVDDEGYIEILPVDDNTIYIPVYAPNVVYYQVYAGTPFITFGVGCSIGDWLDCDFDWHNRHLVVWDRDHPRPSGWWHERPNQRDAYFASRPPPAWRPPNRADFNADRGDRGRIQQSTRPHPVVSDMHVETHPGPGHGVTVLNPIRSNLPGDSHPAASPVLGHLTPGGPAPTAAFIGVQSAQDTRTFSERGRQSMGAVSHSEPHSAPPASHSSGGGGGASHSGGGGGGSSHSGGGSSKR